MLMNKNNNSIITDFIAELTNNGQDIQQEKTKKFIQEIFRHTYSIRESYDPDEFLLIEVCKFLFTASRRSIDARTIIGKFAIGEIIYLMELGLTDKEKEINLDSLSSASTPDEESQEKVETKSKNGKNNKKTGKKKKKQTAKEITIEEGIIG